MLSCPKCGNPTVSVSVFPEQGMEYRHRKCRNCSFKGISEETWFGTYKPPKPPTKRREPGDDDPRYQEHIRYCEEHGVNAWAYKSWVGMGSQIEKDA